MAQTLPSRAYYSSVAWSSVTAWATGATIAAGVLRRQNATPAVGSERVFVAIVAGATHATTEPTWSVATAGQKTTDNTVTWQEVTGQPAVNGDLTNTPLSSQQRSQAVSLGLIIQNNGGTAIFICSTAGTCGSGEPSYTTTAGDTIADGSTTWTCIGSSFSAWAAPCARLNYNPTSRIIASTTTPVFLYVKSDHAETSTSAISIDFGTNNGSGEDVAFICVTGSNAPPVPGDITTGASVTVTTAVNINLARNSSFNGIDFVNSGQLSVITASTSVASMRYDNCSFATSTTSGTIQLGGNGARSRFYNCKLKVGSTATVRVAGDVLFRDSATPLVKLGASWPSLGWLGATQGTDAGYALFENCDFSALDTGSYMVNMNGLGTTKFVFSHCNSPTSGVTFCAQTVVTGAGNVDVVNCDDGTGTHTWYMESNKSEALLTSIATTYRTTAGATDGTTPFSWFAQFWRQSANIFPSFAKPWESPPIDVWINNTGSRTITIEGIYFGTSMPNNDQVWLDVVYLGSASTTLGTRATSTKATVFTSASPLSASTVGWTGTARANTTAYAAGVIIQPSSNTTRLFQVSIAGTSSGSLPVAYASAVDGATITDGTATLHAGWRFTVSVPFTANQKGYARSYLHHALRAASSANAYAGILLFDPHPTVT